MPTIIKSSDFKKEFGDYIEAVCFITLDDMLVHIIDFSIEDAVLTEKDVMILDAGRRNSVVTSYNTLRNSVIYLTDSTNMMQTVVKFSEWGQYFHFNSRHKIEVIDKRFISVNMIAQWQQPQILFRTLLKNVNTKITVISDQLINADPQDYEINIGATNRILGEEICILRINGNLLRGFQDAVYELFNIHLTDNDLNDIATKKYPDISIEKGIKNKYWSLVKMFHI
jgi:hypothetical protein